MKAAAAAATTTAATTGAATTLTKTPSDGTHKPRVYAQEFRFPLLVSGPIPNRRILRPRVMSTASLHIELLGIPPNDQSALAWARELG